MAAIAFPLFFSLVYFGSAAITSRRANVPTLSFAWESRIPFVAWCILPYLSLHVLCAAAFFVCRTRDELVRLVWQLVLVTTLAGVGFVFVPLRFAFQRPAPGAPFGWLFEILHSFDNYNQFPSLHVAITVVLWLIYIRRAPPSMAPVIHAVFALIVLSTVLTYQHHVPDVLAGAVLGLAVIALVRKPA
jgi:membrane-associated phospholipid phosphatase